MKKFLLFLSCFLTTWCSVQAANPQINSVTYNESSSTFSVSYTSNSSNNSVWMISQATGPVGSRVTLGSSPATVDLPITARDGEYNLILYVNGSPCYQKSVTVTKYGHIDKISNISTSKVTVNYSMFHSKSDNFPEKSYLRIVGVANTTREISNVKNGSYTWTGLNLKAGNTYTCEIWVDDKKFDSRTFTVQKKKKKEGYINKFTGISTSSVTVDYTMKSAETNNCYLKIDNKTYYITNGVNVNKKCTGLNLIEDKTYICDMYVDGKKFDSRSFTVPNPWSSKIVSITPMGTGRIKIAFTIRQTGVKVGFRVTTYSGNKGETNYYDYGRYDQHEGTYEVSVPRYTGQVVYAVELFVNGSSVNGNAIQVYNR